MSLPDHVQFIGVSGTDRRWLIGTSLADDPLFIELEHAQHICDRLGWSLLVERVAQRRD
jgi:hypothetical protein